MIAERSIRELIKATGSDKPPLPAGGTTIALNGLLGLALLKLVLQVSLHDWQKKLEKDNINLPELEEGLYQAMDEDIKAFEGNMKNNFSNQQDLQQIITIPLKVARISSKLFELSYHFQGEIKKSVQADLEIARLNLKCSLQGAVVIIQSNYHFFTVNDPFVQEVKQEIAGISKNKNLHN